jgi:hypothetical protein
MLVDERVYQCSPSWPTSMSDESVFRVIYRGWSGLVLCGKYMHVPSGVVAVDLSGSHTRLAVLNPGKFSRALVSRSNAWVVSHKGVDGELAECFPDPIWNPIRPRGRNRGKADGLGNTTPADGPSEISWGNQGAIRLCPAESRVSILFVVVR